MENIKLRDIEAQRPGSVLEEIARRGAQQMLAQAMEAEAALFVEKHADKVDENGHRVVVRNGHMPTRELVTGIGRVPIKQPRVDDRQLAKQGEERFSSAILPRYLKRVASVDSLIPALYLKGVSTGNFSGGPEGDPGRRSPWAEREQRGTAEGGVGAGVSGVDAARSERQAVRVFLGRRPTCERTAG